MFKFVVRLHEEFCIPSALTCIQDMRMSGLFSDVNPFDMYVLLSVIVCMYVYMCMCIACMECGINIFVSV